MCGLMFHFVTDDSESCEDAGYDTITSEDVCLEAMDTHRPSWLRSLKEYQDIPVQLGQHPQ